MREVITGLALIGFLLTFCASKADPLWVNLCEKYNIFIKIVFRVWMATFVLASFWEKFTLPPLNHMASLSESIYVEGFLGPWVFVFYFLFSIYKRNSVFIFMFISVWCLAYQTQTLTLKRTLSVGLCKSNHFVIIPRVAHYVWSPWCGAFYKVKRYSGGLWKCTFYFLNILKRKLIIFFVVSWNKYWKEPFISYDRKVFQTSCWSRQLWRPRR